MREIKQEAIQLTEQINDSIASIYKLLSKELRTPEKLFSIDFADEHYEFFCPTTQEEEKEQSELRNKFINLLLKESLEDVVNFHIPYSEVKMRALWVNVIALVSGADPADHKYGLSRNCE